MKALYYETNDGDRLTCTLCPHRCILSEGKTGICGVRTNRNGSLELPFAGRISSFAVDPVEKKPLYHFYPGKRILSIGFVGCSFHCPFCQNYSISQETHASTRPFSSDEIVRKAVELGSFAIAYTYSEPTNHFEFVMETARRAHGSGLLNVLVSNGYLNPEPARELCSVMDAANIDLKSYSDEFYRKELGGSLEPVKKFLNTAAERTHLEVTTLVIPGKNDSPEEIGSIASFIASLDPEIPLHLSAYHPAYRYGIPSTPPDGLNSLAEICRRALQFVYLGNVSGGSDTLCPGCGCMLVKRDGYSIRMENVKNGKCMMCGKAVPIIGT